MFVADGAYSESKKSTLKPVFTNRFIMSSYLERENLRIPFEEIVPNIPTSDITTGATLVIEISVELAEGSIFEDRDSAFVRFPLDALQALGLR